MTDLANYTQIATLVKGWADQIDAAGSDTSLLPAIVSDMRAFGNGLINTVEVFRPILAQDNDANGNFSGSERNFNCRRFGIEHDPHPWTLDETVYYCDGQGFTARRTPHGSGYCLNPNHPAGCKYPEVR